MRSPLMAMLSPKSTCNTKRYETPHVGNVAPCANTQKGRSSPPRGSERLSSPRRRPRPPPPSTFSILLPCPLRPLSGSAPASNPHAFPGARRRKAGPLRTTNTWTQTRHLDEDHARARVRNAVGVDPAEEGKARGVRGEGASPQAARRRGSERLDGARSRGRTAAPGDQPSFPATRASRMNARPDARPEATLGGRTSRRPSA